MPHSARRQLYDEPSLNRLADRACQGRNNLLIEVKLYGSSKRVVSSGHPYVVSTFKGKLPSGMVVRPSLSVFYQLGLALGGR